MALTGIQERVERSIYEVIRQNLVSEGYWPDVSDTNAFPNNPTGAANWETAIQARITEKGFAIQIFGASSPQKKGEKLVPRIIVQPQRPLPGDIGTPVTEIEKSGSVYSKFKLPFNSANFQINIKFVWKTASQNRVICAILSNALSIRNYISFWDAANATDNFYIENLNTGYDLPDIEAGITESVWNYQVKDLYLAQRKLIEQDGPLINEVTTELKSGKPSKNQPLEDLIKSSE